MPQPLVSPAPAVAGEELLHIGAGLRFMESPTNYLKELRERHGDTFLLDVFGFQLFVTFSAKGLQSLYALAEEKASFGLATFDLVGFKTPTEVLFDADIQLFYQLLLNKKMPGYVDIMNRVVDKEIQRWGSNGEFEVFDTIRTLEQRVGYALWIAEEAAADDFWPLLKQNFDVLDQERSFVDPKETLETIKTNKKREKDAVRKLSKLIRSIIEQHDQAQDTDYAAVDYLRDHFSQFSEQEQTRKIIHNTINANQGFLSNLYAAIAWVIVRLEQYPIVKEKVLTEIGEVRRRFGKNFLQDVNALNEMNYLEQVMMESVRLAQRSLTLRKVLQPIQFDDGETVYNVEPGVYIATMLSVTNTQTEELARFDPDHYDKNKLVASLPIAGKETISTFGHGKHACPAQRFSHHMCKIVVGKLLLKFDFEAHFENPQPAEKQMGGVSRPAQQTMMHYQCK